MRSDYLADLPRLGNLLHRRGLDPIPDGTGSLVADATITDTELATLSREAAGLGITLVELARTAASLEERYGSLVTGGVR